MSNTPNPSPSQGGAPRIEALLEQAHANVSALGVARLRLLQRGLSADDLPSEEQLMAYAFLGDHDRDVLLAQLRGTPWQQITDRSLVGHESVEAQTTAMLRLLAHLVPHLPSIDTLADRLATADALAEPQQGLLRIRGKTTPCYWGEPLELQVVASRRVVAMRIHADDSLDVEPLLLRADAAGPIVQDIEVLADEGRLHLTVEDDTGAVFRLSQPIQLAASPEELWQ